MPEETWHDLGSVEELRRQSLRTVTIQRTKIALTCSGGTFGAISGVCNHAGGPLGEGRLDGEYVVCPWHNWRFHARTGEGEPGFEEDKVPSYAVKVEGGHVWLNLRPVSERHKLPHPSHPLARSVAREDGPIRVAGISTTVMDRRNPRFSASDELLETSLRRAAAEPGVQTRLIRLNELSFRACEGYYSKSAHACTWPCSITQMDPDDQLDQVYEAFVHWADVVLIATPIRWGAASSLYYKMVERMNCVQNQITLRNKVLLRNKVVAFVILGGQDNVQAVAGQMLAFFSELGCLFPQFPFIAHSRGWAAEDMERNVAFVRQSKELHAGAEALVLRAVEMARTLLDAKAPEGRLERGGRKAYRPAAPVAPEGE